MNTEDGETMSTRIDYYFQHLERFPFAGYFDGLTETWQILEKAKSYLNTLLTDKNVCENHGICKGEAPALYNNYYIGEGTVIYNDVTIIGPVYIGKDCELMPGAIIRPGTIIADGCSVGHGSEVKRSVLFGGSKVASLAFVGDTVLGASARIGSGVITANRRFDQSNAVLKVDGVKSDLHDSFFGCILGDSARIGANSVTQPGTHIGHHTWVFPLTCVRGFIPSGRHVYNNSGFTTQEAEIVELNP